jgi:threonine synthase
VVISTAHGLKFSNFKVDYHESKLNEVVSQFANPPVEVEPDLDAVRRVLENWMERPVGQGMTSR